MLGRQSMFAPLRNVCTSMGVHGSSLCLSLCMAIAIRCVLPYELSCFCSAEQVHVAGEGSFLQRFFSATTDMDPAQRGAYLEHPPVGAPDIDEAHHVSYSTQGHLPWEDKSVRTPAFGTLTEA